MNYQTGGKPLIGCLGALAVAMLLATFLSTSSLNPVRVYTSESLAAKIIVSLIGFLIASVVLRWALLSALQGSIRLIARKPAEDVICSACGLPLIQYAGSHGAPMPCPRCRRWYHMGPACYTKGLEQNRMTFGLPCPHCRAAFANERELFGELGE